MTSTNQNTGIAALNVSLQQAIMPLFWGAVLTAAVVPIAGALGAAAGGKLFPEPKNKQ